MKKVLWCIAVPLAIVLTAVFAISAIGQQQPEAPRVLLLGQVLVDPSIIQHDSIIAPPIGKGGKVTGFAFAVTTPDLAYCAVEADGEDLVSVLRIASMPSLWFPRDMRQEPTFKDAQGKTHSWVENIPFGQREREVYKVKLDPSQPNPPVAMVGPLWWSPDGMKLGVCATMDDPGAPKQRDLWIIDRTSGKRTEVTRGAIVTSVAWSSDSKSLAVATGKPDGPSLVTAPRLASAGVWMVTAQTGAAAKIAEAGTAPEWSSDGKLVRFAVGNGMREYDIAVKVVRQAKTPFAPAPFWAISRDGKYAARTVADGTDRRLELRTRSTGGLKLAMSDVSRFGCWSRDGNLVLFFDKKGALQATVLTGKDTGRRVKVPADSPQTQAAQGTVDWSARIPLLAIPVIAGEAKDERKRDEFAKQGISWVAYTSGDQLRTTAIAYRLPEPGEAQQLGLGVTTSYAPLRTTVLSNMKQVTLAMLMYAQDWDDLLPPPNQLPQVALGPYTKNNSLFMNPANPKQMIFQPTLPAGIPLNSIPNPSQIPIGIMDYGEREGVIVGYADGHCIWCRRDRLAEVMMPLRELRIPLR